MGDANSTKDKLGRPANIPGLFIYGGELARQGYRLNKALVTLHACEVANRARFAADERRYLDGLDLSELERNLILKRDFAGLLQHGANAQLLYRAALALGLEAKELARAGGADIDALNSRLSMGGYHADKQSK